MTIKYVYISGPYSKGNVNDNVRNAIFAAEDLIDCGYIPFVQHLSHFWDFLSCHPYPYWMEMDLEWVTRCDAVLRLPGESVGADKEVACADANNIPVFYSMQSLLDNKIREKDKEQSLKKLLDELETYCLV
jgi:hypothetical protein